MQPYASIPMMRLTGIESKRKLRFPVFDRTQFWKWDGALDSHVAHAICWHGSLRVARHYLGDKGRGFLQRMKQFRMTAKNLLLDLGKRPLTIAQSQHGQPSLSPRSALRDEARLGSLKVFFAKKHAFEGRVL